MYDASGNWTNYLEHKNVLRLVVAQQKMTHDHHGNVDTMDNGCKKIQLHLFDLTIDENDHDKTTSGNLRSQSQLQLHKAHSLTFAQIFLMQHQVIAHSYWFSLFLRIDWLLTVDVDEFVTPTVIGNDHDQLQHQIQQNNVSLMNNETTNENAHDVTILNIIEKDFENKRNPYYVINIGNYEWDHRVCWKYHYNNLLFDKKRAQDDYNLLFYSNFMDLMPLRQRKYNHLSTKSLFKPRYVSEVSIHSSLPLKLGQDEAIDNSKKYLTIKHFREIWKNDSCSILLDDSQFAKRIIQHGGKEFNSRKFCIVDNFKRVQSTNNSTNQLHDKTWLC